MFSAVQLRMVAGKIHYFAQPLDEEQDTSYSNLAEDDTQVLPQQLKTNKKIILEMRLNCMVLSSKTSITFKCHKVELNKLHQTGHLVSALHFRF